MEANNLIDLGDVGSGSGTANRTRLREAGAEVGLWGRGLAIASSSALGANRTRLRGFGVEGGLWVQGPAAVSSSVHKIVGFCLASSGMRDGELDPKEGEKLASERVGLSESLFREREGEWDRGDLSTTADQRMTGSGSEARRQAGEGGIGPMGGKSLRSRHRVGGVSGESMGGTATDEVTKAADIVMREKK
jgi:hypothetical protein